MAPRHFDLGHTPSDNRPCPGKCYDQVAVHPEKGPCQTNRLVGSHHRPHRHGSKGPRELRQPSECLRAPMVYGDTGDMEPPDDMAQKVHPTPCRLQEGHLELRLRQFEDEPRDTYPRSKVE